MARGEVDPCPSCAALRLALAASQQHAAGCTAQAHGATSLLVKMEAEAVIARATIARLNRRAQQAEAIADRCIPGRPMTGPGLGRALANYAAARLGEVAREAVEGWAAAARCEGACQHGHECAPSAELVARLDALTGEARATVAGMASPHSPPPTKSLPSLLAEIETAAQEAMRLHPHALHLRSVLALCAASRAAAGCEVGPPVGPPAT